MSRLIPHPLLSVILVWVWCMLNSFSIGHFLLGCVIALVAGKLFARLEPKPVKIHAFWPLFRLAGRLFVDIIRSNIAVAGLILSRGRYGKRHSDFVQIPLRLQSEAALALLALAITATPGTAWMDYDTERNVLTLHVFDMIDPTEWPLIIRNRYEQLLLEALG